MAKAKLTVLVVEDEPLICMDTAIMLDKAGFDVIEAADTDEAIPILEATPSIWAIFTDVDMPGSMDGIRLAHAVRDQWPPIHIFVTSGHRMVETADLPGGGRFFASPMTGRQTYPRSASYRNCRHLRLAEFLGALLGRASPRDRDHKGAGEIEGVVLC